MPEVLAIIPARSGSKGVIDKNIRLCNCKPLLAYSIEHALKANSVNRVIVSTDSEHYADIARMHGAEVPFIRPPDISGDYSLDIEVFEHCLKFLKNNKNYIPDICVHLRPTHPVREPYMIDEMVQLLLDNPEWDSVRSVSLSPITPYKMWNFEKNGVLSPIVSCDIKEAYNAPRQILPKTYIQNACIDVVRSSVILEKSSMTGGIIGGYVQKADFDIDTESEFLKAELYLEIKERVSNGERLRFCVDIDGVIAAKTEQNDYSKAEPNLRSISFINKMHSLGHYIVLFTARGSATGIDWEQTTKKQLGDWNVKYSELKFGKPAATIYIDDRLLSIDHAQILMDLTEVMS
ncbi:MAG: acylneuraminate cytidylyltransferase family protein [Oscillospiraceae bacterium]|nr:acylneuraminate cytidylyltransferase family protein [Oscillospiraceae bacterium]